MRIPRSFNSTIEFPPGAAPDPGEDWQAGLNKYVAMSAQGVELPAGLDAFTNMVLSVARTWFGTAALSYIARGAVPPMPRRFDVNIYSRPDRTGVLATIDVLHGNVINADDLPPVSP